MDPRGPTYYIPGKPCLCFTRGKTALQQLRQETYYLPSEELHVIHFSLYCSLRNLSKNELAQIFLTSIPFCIDAAEFEPVLQISIFLETPFQSSISDNHSYTIHKN